MMLSRVKWLLLFVPLFVLSSSMAHATHDEPYNRILTGWPTSLNPATLEDIRALHLILQTAEGLVAFEKNRIVPGLAERWEVSEDLLSYKFYLRKDGKFSDGTKITADDVARSYKNLLSKKSLMWRDLRIIKGAEEFHTGQSNVVSGIQVLDELTIVFFLNNQFSPFLEMIASPSYVILPTSSLNVLVTDQVVPFVSSGPYRFASIEKNNKIQIEKNPFYRSAAGIDLALVNYFIVDNSSDAVSGLIEGRFHDIWPYSFGENDVPTAVLNRMQKIPSLSMESWIIQFNLDHVQTKNIFLREFIRNNLDVPEYLTKSGHPKYFQSFQLIPRGMLGYSVTQTGYSGHESRANEELLGKAGCSLDKPCHVDFVIADDFQMKNVEALFQPIDRYQKYIKINIQRVDRNKWYNMLISGEIPMSYYAHTSSYFDTYSILRYFLLDEFSRGIDRTKIAPLLLDALKTDNRVDRAAIYKAVDDAICQQIAIIPIMSGNTPFRYVDKNYTGFYDLSFGYYFLKMKDVKYKGDQI